MRVYQQQTGFYLRLRDNVEFEFLIDETGSGLRQVSLVEDETAAAEAAGTAHLLHPFGPLGIQLTIRLLVFGLEHANRFLSTRNRC